MAHDSPSCPNCGASLDSEKVCLACVFDEALEAERSAAGDGAESGFGVYARPDAGVFGKFSLRQKRGEGGMGVIWEAEDTSLGRVVALKMIRGFAFSSDIERQRFHAEANAVAQLDHPNIVPIYEVGAIEDQPYFTMKLLLGGTLSQRMKDGAMEPREAAAIMEKLARAIHHAHERGILHRDLKPDNVLLDEKGEPYLTDFGLAKMMDSSAGLTRTHAYVGTPQYMSPEQARGRASDITAASDVWAAGALFYHMLTGRLPFAGESSGEIFDRIANEKPAAMQTSATPVDKELETLCRRCLEKDPARRPSARALSDELGRWLEGEPIQSKPRPVGWMQRYAWQVAVSAVMLSLLVTTAFFWPSHPSEPPASTTAPARQALSAKLDAVVQRRAPGTDVAVVFLEGDRRLYQSGDHGVEVHVRVKTEVAAIMEHAEQANFDFLQRNGLLDPKSTRGWFDKPQDLKSDFRAIHFEPGMTRDTTIWWVRSNLKDCWDGDTIIQTGDGDEQPFFRVTENLIPYGNWGEFVAVTTNDHEAELGIANAAIYLSNRGWLDLHWKGDKTSISNSHATYFLPAGATLQALGLRPGTSGGWEDEIFGKVTLIVQPE